jgi:hypothetical protein
MVVGLDWQGVKPAQPGVSAGMGVAAVALRVEVICAQCQATNP